MTRQLTDRNKLTAFQFSLSHTFNQKSKQKQKQKQEAMEIQSGKGSSKVRARNEKMSLEDYLDFVLSHKQIDLTANFLNQVSHFAFSSSNFVMLFLYSSSENGERLLF
jgi:hypothetical protein